MVALLILGLYWLLVLAAPTVNPHVGGQDDPVPLNAHTRLKAYTSGFV